MGAVGYGGNTGLQGCVLSLGSPARGKPAPCCEDTQESPWGEVLMGRNLLVPTASGINVRNEDAILEVDPPAPVRPSDGTGLADALMATS